MTGLPGEDNAADDSADNSADDAEERRLFQEAVRGVRPLRHRPAAPNPPTRLLPRARFARAERVAVLKESLEVEGADPQVASGEELVFRRPQVQAAVLRKLRRGEYRVQREIDLHGLTVAQAKAALRAFLVEATDRHVRCVRIIHGKGLRSGHRGPVLKSAVSSVLRRTGAVLAYVSARPVDGGTGAVYVLLSND